MREVIPTRLWIGSALDAREITNVLDCGIAVVIDLAIEEPPIQFPRDIVYCRFPLIDGAGNQSAILRAAVETVAHFMGAGTPTLVACGVGMSRSPAIVAAALAQTERIALMAALAQLTTGQPHDVSPGLLQDLVKVSQAAARIL